MKIPVGVFPAVRFKKKMKIPVGVFPVVRFKKKEALYPNDMIKNLLLSMKSDALKCCYNRLSQQGQGTMYEIQFPLSGTLALDQMPFAFSVANQIG